LNSTPPKLREGLEKILLMCMATTLTLLLSALGDYEKVVVISFALSKMAMHLRVKRVLSIPRDDRFAVFHRKLSPQESAMLNRHGAALSLLMVHSQSQVGHLLWKLPVLDLKQHLLLWALHEDLESLQKLAKFVEWIAL
jgi:hypothetical protein